MSDETPTAPFTFRAATPAGAKKNSDKPKSFAAQQVAALHEQAASRPRRKRATPAEPKKQRRKRLSPDVAVLKACLRNLRKLDPKDALRTIETLRVLFK